MVYAKNGQAVTYVLEEAWDDMDRSVGNPRHVQIRRRLPVGYVTESVACRDPGRGRGVLPRVERSPHRGGLQRNPWRASVSNRAAPEG